MGQYHPHGDTAIYDTLVRLGQPWSLRYPLVQSQGNFGSPGDDRQAAMRYTECRLAPLAMEMVRDIDQETVDFAPNYDGRQQEPTVLPARFPNLLVNGSGGIAVGMATNIPPHNLREVAAGVQWHLDHPEAIHEELLDGAARADQGTGLPDQGPDRRHPRHPGRLPHRPRLGHDARGRRGRGGQPRPHHPGHHRAALPGQPGRAGPQDRRARRHAARCRASPTCATTRRRAPACAWSSCSSATPSRAWCATTSTSTPSCRTPSAATCSRWSTACRAPWRWTRSSGTGSTHQIEVIVRRTHVPAAPGRGARPHPARPAQGARPRSTRSSR